ncbi:MAG: 5'-nucleotidase C-terminal domain-containing protein [Myxococcales bacterium]|nr:5'-nucleotidase C-terminal domain-containing protein [Myxococcales bacterium]
MSRPFSLLALSLALVYAAPARGQIYDPDAPASRPTSRPASRPTSRPAAPPPAELHRLHVLYTADLYGRFSWPGCRRLASSLGGLNADFSHFIGALRARRSAIKRAGGASLTVMGGSMTRPDLLGIYTFRRDEPARLAHRLLRMADLDAVGVGLYDFGARPDHVQRYLTGLAKSKIAALAANVTCKRADDFRCRAFGVGEHRYQIVKRGGLKVGIFGLVRGDLLDRVLPRSRVGLKVKDPTKVARQVVATLREKEKVDLVVLIANVNVESDTPQPVVDLLRGLVKPQHRVDIVLANAMFERDGDRFVGSMRVDNGPVVVGTDRFAQTLGELTVTWERERGHVIVKDVKVARHDASHFEPAKRAVPSVRRLLSGVCKTYDRVLGPARIKGSILRNDFMRYLLEIMRHHEKAEIAVLNHSAIADTTFPMSGRLTAETILRTIRSETKVGSVKMTGERLKALLSRHLGIDGELAVIGVEKKDGSWTVNGRQLVTGERYRVALSSFVAAGGDGLLKLSKSSESFSASELSLRRLVTEFLSKGGASSDGDPSLDARKDFPDLENRWLISTNMSLGFGLSTISVHNNFEPSGATRYTVPLLRRDNVTTLSFDARFDFSMTARNHSIETQVQLQYARAYTRAQPTVAAPAPETVDAEALDRILVSASYRLRALRSVWGKKWWVPQPYAEAILITEFSPSGIYTPNPQNPDVTDTYHYADLSGIVGIGLQPHSLIFLKVGFVQRGELFTPDNARTDSRGSRGLYLGYQLKPWKIVANASHPLSLESRLDFYATSLAATNRVEGTLQSKLTFGLTRYIALGVSHRFYMFDNVNHDIAYANDLTVLLGVTFDVRRQTF